MRKKMDRHSSVGLKLGYVWKTNKLRQIVVFGRVSGTVVRLTMNLEKLIFGAQAACLCVSCRCPPPNGRAKSFKWVLGGEGA